MVIKWINKYSKETGFVMNVDYLNKHFNNTFDFNKAKKFKSREIAEKTIEKLIEYGEGKNNDFEIVEWNVSFTW